MKTQIDRANLSTVSAEMMYYGFSFGKRKGFVTREKYGKGRFVLVAKDGATNGNQWTAGDNRLNSLRGALEFILDTTVVEVAVYEFDNSGELFQWLSAENS
jgi:hypothetical protein